MIVRIDQLNILYQLFAEHFSLGSKCSLRLRHFFDAGKIVKSMLDIVLIILTKVGVSQIYSISRYSSRDTFF